MKNCIFSFNSFPPATGFQSPAEQPGCQFQVAACETFNFSLQKSLLLLVRKILAQDLIAEINLDGAISRIRLPEMDHWLSSTICTLNALEQKKPQFFSSALSLKSHKFLNSRKERGAKGTFCSQLGMCQIGFLNALSPRRL